MKKFLVLLFVPLLLSAAFAANFTMSSTMKLDVQIQILSFANQLSITPTQAASLSSSMEKLKNTVNSIEKERIKALTSLRDALLNGNKEDISKAKEPFKSLEKAYLKAVESFKNSVASVITLEQALEAKRIALNFLRQWHGPLSDMFKNFAINERDHMKPMSEFGPNQKPTSKHPMLLKKGKRLEDHNLILRKTEFLHSIVNSNLYALMIRTLEMKAATK